MSKITTTDIHGKTVYVGNHVFVLAIDLEKLNYLSTNELQDIGSMLGEKFEVEEINKSGNVKITKMV